MKQLIIFFLVCCNLVTFAQGGALADLKFEEAATAFNNQEYETTINKLDEFDKLYGSITTTSLYLRLITTDNTIDYIKEFDSKGMINFEKKVNAYLSSFEKEQIDDKYREIYKISQKIKNSLNIKEWSEMPEYKAGYEEYEAENFIEALKWFEKAADKNNALAMSSMGTIYAIGDKAVEQDFFKSYEWISKAAKFGEIQASLVLGTMYFGGSGVEKNEDLAKKYLINAAEMGLKEAMYILGKIELNNNNYPDAEYWFKKAAKKKDSDAMNDLGDMYYYGNGVQKNYNEALHWYKLSSESEKSTFSLNASAINSIGNMYFKGTGVQQDFQKALDYYQKAATQGWNYAFVNLGNMYLEGNGVVINIDEAINWFSKVKPNFYDDYENATEGAKNGLAKAYFLLAEKYFKNSQFLEAIESYKKAHASGNNDAKYRISKIYREGLGVLKDKKLAKEWENK